jgi:RimJ/RimL family protein N-acetyltransferase
VPPRPITLETTHYQLRTLQPADATEAWARWLSDPKTALQLNAKPRHLSIPEVRAYIAKFDSNTSFLFGIFEKETQSLIGVRAVYVDPKKREFLDNILVGDPGARGKHARSESSAAVWRYFFEDRDLLVARGAIVATNAHMLEVALSRGWVHDKTSQVPAAHGAGLVELRHVRLDRDTWRRVHRDREPADTAKPTAA